MRPERLDPGRGEALPHRGMELLRDRLRQPACSRSRAVATSSSSRPGSSTASHGYVVGARLTACDSTRDLIRRFHHSGFDLGRLLEHKTEPITAVLPAREVADTVGQIVERLRSLDR